MLQLSSNVIVKTYPRPAMMSGRLIADAYLNAATYNIIIVKVTVEINNLARRWLFLSCRVVSRRGDTDVYIYIYIYIERERDIHVNTYICTYTYIYIYIYIYRERERDTYV